MERRTGFALAAGVALLAGWALAQEGAAPDAAAAQAIPYRGELVEGATVRAVLMKGHGSRSGLIEAVDRSEAGVWRSSPLRFPDARLDLAEPTLVVFRVGGSSLLHTPPFPDGTTRYYRLAHAELVAVEMTESEAVRRARACLDALGSPVPAAAAGGEPFTYGPGERGGWVVRFAGAGAGEAVEFEIAADGGCHRVAGGAPQPP